MKLHCAIISYQFFFTVISDAYNILAIVPTPAYSHQHALWPVWEALANNGHQVTLVTTDTRSDVNANITQLDISNLYKIKTFSMNEESMKSYELFGMFGIIYHIVINFQNDMLSQDAVQELIRDKTLKKFDVVIAECWTMAFYAFSHKFNTPLIGISTIDGATDNHVAFGNPTNPVLYPRNLISHSYEGFIGKVLDVTIYFIQEIWYVFLHNAQNQLVYKHFGTEYPTVQELIDSMDMMFTNENPAYQSYLRPSVGAVVNIGGDLNRKPPKKLPKDLQDYLDSAKEGIIYFSLGSNVKSKDLTDQEKMVIMDTFTELPYKVLWKFEADELPGKPKNVKLIKWAPQQDVLRHPNIKLFITQGGIQSIDEAIFSHVPMVVMPFFGDQPNNAKKIVSKGFALEVDHFNLEKESLKATILEVITNPKYKETVTRLSKLALDQPMTGIEKAVWWTEYVIRHKGAKHLKSHAVNVPFWQYMMLDVIGFLLLVISVVFFVIYKLIKLVFTLICKLFGKNCKKTQQKPTNKIKTK